MTDARQPARTRIALLAMALLIAAIRTAAAGETPCPLAGQKPMLVVRLYFGQGREGGKPLSAREWRSFVSLVVTPRFPDGFTVYDAYGQWMDPRIHAIGHEPAKVVEIATQDTMAAGSRIGEISHAYRDKFHQQSVGIVTTSGCGLF